MKIVGDKLVELAQDEQGTNIENASLYAKTAYNRYYYSSFLFGRKVLLQNGLISSDPKRKLGHGGEFGKCLQSGVKPKIIKAIKKSFSTQEEQDFNINTVNEVCKKISFEIMFMYEARDAADYKKDCTISFIPSGFNITFKKGNKDTTVEIEKIKNSNKDIKKSFEILSNICVEIGLI